LAIESFEQSDQRRVEKHPSCLHPPQHNVAALPLFPRRRRAVTLLIG
jgi:hypothetical protein